MGISELKEKLDEIGYRLGAANICGDGSPEGLTITKGETWEVYFMERGQKFDLSIHTHENCACNDFFQRAKKEFDSGHEYYTKNFKPTFLDT